MINIKYAFIGLSVFALQTLNAQTTELIKQVPSDAIAVVSIKGGQLQQKVAVGALEETESVVLLQKAVIKNLLGRDNVNSNAPALIGNLDKSGIVSNSTSYFFFQYVDETVLTSYIFNISDRALFESFLSDQIIDSNRVELVLRNGIRGFQLKDQDIVINWSDKIGKISLIKKEYSAPVEDYSYDYGQSDYQEVNQDSLDAAERLADLQHVEEVVNSSYDVVENASEVTGFNATQSLSGDVLVWINNASYTNIYRTILQKAPMMKPFVTAIQKLYTGSYSSLSINLTNEGIDAQMKSVASDEIMKYNKSFLNSSFDKNLFKYIPENPTFCLASTMNPRAGSDLMTDLVYPLIQEVPTYGQAITDVLDIVGTIIDEDALYDVFEGDVVVMSNGSVVEEREVTSFEYDEEYNYTEVTKMDSTTIPLLTIMLSTKDETFWKKLISLPTVVPFFVKEGDYVYAEQGGFTFYFAVKNNVVFISTNSNLITNHLESGLPKAMRLASEKKKLFKKYNSLFFMDDLNDEFEEVEGGEYVKEALSIIGFKNILATGYEFEKNALVSNFTFKMGDGSQHIINTLFQMGDDLMAYDKEFKASKALEESAVEEDVAE